jgi:serine/threonine protein kinase
MSQLGLDTSQNLYSLQTSAKRQMKQKIGCLCSAIAYLHQNRIRHKDIKPSNILLSANGLWVTDFGTSTDFSTLAESLAQNGERGTPKYFAPEVADFEPNGRPADIFSLGCVLLEMVGLCNDYSLDYMKNLRQLKDSSFQANLKTILRWFDKDQLVGLTIIDRHLFGIVRQMLSVDPINRPAALEVLTRLRLIDALGKSWSIWDQCCSPMPSLTQRIYNSTWRPVKIVIGNRYQRHDVFHQWEFFIEFSMESIIDKIHVLLVCKVSCFVCTLLLVLVFLLCHYQVPFCNLHLTHCLQHPSFKRSYHILHNPPYVCRAKGWGYFTINVLVALKTHYSWVDDTASSQDDQSLLPLSWELNFDSPLSKVEFNFLIQSG